MRTPIINVRIPDDMHRRLLELADRTGRTKSFYVLEAIDLYLAEFEGVYLVKQAPVSSKRGQAAKARKAPARDSSRTAKRSTRKMAR